MRTISAGGLAALATNLGTEPITIIEIDWAAKGTMAYADRTVGTIPGRIIELGELDDVIGISSSSGTQELSIVLDDSDGTIKTILDGHDIHKRPARVYQYFSGLALTDKFLLFSGELSSPISWNERDRTVKVTILSHLEDQECGYTTDQNIGGVVSDTIPSAAWPLIFGTVADNKAVQLRPPVSGTTLTPVGVLGGAELMISSPDDPGIEFCSASTSRTRNWTFYRL